MVEGSPTWLALRSAHMRESSASCSDLIPACFCNTSVRVCKWCRDCNPPTHRWACWRPSAMPRAGCSRGRCDTRSKAFEMHESLSLMNESWMRCDRTATHSAGAADNRLVALNGTHPRGSQAPTRPLLRFYCIHDTFSLYSTIYMYLPAPRWAT
jgi:hypothetical protein